MKSKIIKTSPRNQEGPLSFLGGHAEDMEEKDYFKISLRSGFWNTALQEFTQMMSNTIKVPLRSQACTLNFLVGCSEAVHNLIIFDRIS